MEEHRTDISTFERDSTFYGRIEMLLTVKSFDLQEIRQRYLKSRARKDNRTGSVERRAVAIGGVVHAVIENGKMTESKVIAKLKEPRGIAGQRGFLGISAENEVYILGDDLRSIENPWFSYIHTLDFHPDGDKLLISSSGLDCIFEYDLTNLRPSYEWFAWEHGFNKGKDPETGKEILLSRNADDAGEGVKVILDPRIDVLPTAMRAAFINSVVYDKQDPSRMLATFFHEGAVYCIHMSDGRAVKVLDGLKNPHGGGRNGVDVFATSTGKGEVVMQNEGERKVLDFQNLKGKPQELGEMEWLQNSHYHGNNIVTIDSNRTSFVVTNVEHQKIDLIPYDPNWAVQDMLTGSFEEHQLELLSSLSL